MQTADILISTALEMDYLAEINYFKMYFEPLHTQLGFNSCIFLPISCEVETM